MQSRLPLFLTFIRFSSAKCIHDNCARAVVGAQQGPDQQAIASSDCNNFLKTTVTPPASTVSVTFTSILNVTNTAQLYKRQVTSTIPDYAGDCLGAAAFASACSCFGLVSSTITAPAPVSTDY